MKSLRDEVLLRRVKKALGAGAAELRSFIRLWRVILLRSDIRLTTSGIASQF